MEFNQFHIYIVYNCSCKNPINSTFNIIQRLEVYPWCISNQFYRFHWFKFFFTGQSNAEIVPWEYLVSFFDRKRFSFWNRGLVHRHESHSAPDLYGCEVTKRRPKTFSLCDFQMHISTLFIFVERWWCEYFMDDIQNRIFHPAFYHPLEQY